MIILNLCCNNQHVFEGWFKGETEYKYQLAKGLLSCPYCDSQDISDQSSPHILAKSFSQELNSQLSSSKLTSIEKQTIIEQLGDYIEHNTDIALPALTDFKFELLQDSSFSAVEDELHDDNASSMYEFLPKKILQ